MNWKQPLSVALVSLLLGSTASMAGNSPQEQENKRIAEMWVRAAIPGDWAKVAPYMAPDFKTHDWHEKAGDLASMKEGFEGMTKMASMMKLQFEPGARVYADGDYAIVHYVVSVTTQNGMEKHAGVEILRFANGKIAEHWNSDQKLPLMSPNPNGPL